MNDARAHILARIRTALSAPTRHEAPHPDAAPAQGPDREGFAECLPPVPPEASEWPALFAARLEALSGTCRQVSDDRAAAEALAGLARDEAWTRVSIQSDPLVQRAAASLDVPAHRPGGRRDDLAACDASITTCRALVAQTGSVLVTAADGGRIGSVLAPHHVVVATTGQLVPDLPAAWKSLTDTPPSFASLITGPSRTADIERTLVLGAHGPIRLTVLLIG